MKWKQDGKDRIHTTKVCGAKISIHRHIHYEKDDWLLSCYNLYVDNHVLKSKDLEEAKAEGIGLLKDYLTKFLKELNSD